MADCKVVLNADQNRRWLKVLKAKEPAPSPPGEDEEGNVLPVPKPKTDAQLIQDNLLDHISGQVLYKERQEASSSVKEF